MDGTGAQQRAQRPAPAAWRRPRRLLLVLDPVAALLVILASMSFYVGETPWHVKLGADGAGSTTLFLVLFVLFTLVVLARLGSYSSQRRLSRIDDGILLVKALVWAFVMVIGVAFVSKGFGSGFTDYSRRVVLTGVLVALVGFGVARVIAWYWQHQMFTRREGVRRVVVVGTGAAAAEFARFVRERSWLGTECVGALRVLDEPLAVERAGGLVCTVPVLGDLAGADCVVDYSGVDELVVALDEDECRDLAGILRRLIELDVPFRTIPSLFEHTYAHERDTGLAGVATVSYHVEPMDRAQRAAKRLLDTIVAALVLLVLSPFLAVVALLVKLTSPGPVLFRQQRVGQHGRVFGMHKFRTMYVGAEARLADVAHLNEGQDVLFKIRNDPRITPVGRFLRRWSIDELPQFYDVLKGDMSVVGPRPPLRREVSLYETPQLARLKGKPGITGLWQVSGRSDLTFEQMVDLDRYYLENWSFGLDVSIMLRTGLAIARRSGAY
jgi:exopolysaccharide biosynthesis polyprenyl glycosylphosphotransferase